MSKRWAELGGADAPTGSAPGDWTVAEDAQLAADVAQAAGEVLLPQFRRPASGVRAKGDPRELVSEADLAADLLIREALRSARPSDAVLTEEAPPVPGQGARRWLVDPLDGTTNFLTGLPYWCVSIALEDADGLCVGAVHDPIRDETFMGGRELGLRVNGLPADVRSVTTLGEAVLAVHLQPATIGLPTVSAMLDQALGVRETGSTALDLAWVAAGRFDGCLFRRTKNVWDWAAGCALVEAGGGVVAETGLPIEQGTIAAGRHVARAFHG